MHLLYALNFLAHGGWKNKLFILKRLVIRSITMLLYAIVEMFNMYVSLFEFSCFPCGID
jgi:hypothetical protein